MATIKPLWTQEEIELLMTHYPILGPEMTQLPGRTYFSIIRKAGELGIYKNFRAQGAQWKASEINLLRKNYKKMTCAEIQIFIPRHSVSSIKSKAHHLGILKNDKSWTAKEVEMLKENYRQLGPGIPGLEKRSRKSIIVKANKLGLIWENTKKRSGNT